MSSARARAAARCWATSTSRRARTRPSTFRIRTRPTRPCSINVLTERARRPLAKASILALALDGRFSHHRVAEPNVRNGMTYESMLAERVAFRGHRGEVGEAYYARPL